MKLRRLISLTLVLAMMFTMFAALTVSAEGTATFSYVVYDESGENKVEGSLVKGSTYQIALVLSDISEESFNSVQVATYYNPEILQAVKKSGEAATAINHIVIENNPMYSTTENEDGDIIKSGIYSRMDEGSDLDATNGLIKYVLTVDTGAEDADGNRYEEGVANDGTFEICRYRFKAIENGKTDLQVAVEALGEGKYNPALKEGIGFVAKTEAVAVTSVNPAIRVGEVAYVSATVDEAFSASKEYALDSTTKEEVLADLAEEYPTVNVTFVDEEDEVSAPVCAAITWEADPAFDAEKAGTYKFVGTVAVPAGYNYTEKIEVYAEVTVQPLEVIHLIISIVNKTVREGDPEPVKPSKVQALVNAYSITEGYAIYELDVVWSDPVKDETNPNKVVSTYTGTISGTDKITVPDALKTLTFVVTTLKKSTTNEIKEETNVKEIDLKVDAGEIEPAGDVITVDDVKAQLPKFVELDDGFINVEKWEIVTNVATDYQYQFGDVLEFKPVFAEGITMTKDFTAKVSAIVPDGKKNPPVFNKTSVEIKTKTDAGYTIAKAIEESGIFGKYGDDTVIKASDINWDKDTTPAFKATVANTYDLEGAWSDAYGHSETFKISIVVEQAGADSFYFATDKLGKKELKKELKMVTGLDTADVYVFFTPNDADDEIVEWKNSNDKVVEIIKNSADFVRIRTKSRTGNATITAVAKSGISNSFEVKVAYDPNDDVFVSGSYGSSGSSILSQTVEQIAGQEAAQNSVFGDLAGFEWAATQVDTLRLLGIVSGKSATSYAPADSVTRAEYLAMLVRLLNLKANGEAKAFTDVNAGDWFYDVVNVASSLGIAYGYENGAFDPNAVIKRQDMAVFAKRAIDVAGLNPMVGLSSTFEDQADIAPYALDAVLFMTSVGAINGMGDGTFKPLETANRAQAAVVIYNIYSFKN